MNLNDFADHQVLQRRLGASSRDVRLEATCQDPTVARCQAQVVRFDTNRVIVPWTNLDLAGAATFAGTLEVPQGGWYRSVLRGLDREGHEVARTQGGHRWGVGMNILCIGQSNMVGHGGSVYTVAGDLAGLYGNDRAWQHLSDPYDRGGKASDVDFDESAGASLVPSLVNALSRYFPGLPLGVVPAAKGATPLHDAGSGLCWGDATQIDRMTSPRCTEIRSPKRKRQEAWS